MEQNPSGNKETNEGPFYKDQMQDVSLQHHVAVPVQHVDGHGESVDGLVPIQHRNRQEESVDGPDFKDQMREGDLSIATDAHTNSSSTQINTEQRQSSPINTLDDDGPLYKEQVQDATQHQLVLAAWESESFRGHEEDGPDFKVQVQQMTARGSGRSTTNRVFMDPIDAEPLKNAFSEQRVPHGPVYYQDPDAVRNVPSPLQQSRPDPSGIYLSNPSLIKVRNEPGNIDRLPELEGRENDPKCVQTAAHQPHESAPNFPLETSSKDTQIVHRIPFNKITWTGLGVAILIAAAILASVCGSGHCKSSSSLPPLPAINKQDLSSTTSSVSEDSLHSTQTTAPSGKRFKSFETTKELYEAVDLYLIHQKGGALNQSNTSLAQNASWVLETYGFPIGSWDVSQLTNFSYVFSTESSHRSFISEKKNTSRTIEKEEVVLPTVSFNEDVSNWDVSKAKTMRGMFYGATDFRQDLSKWNIENVENIDEMFWYAESFDSNLSLWNTANLVSAESAFGGAYSFTGEGLQNWKTSRFNDTQFMFFNAAIFDCDLSSWDMSNVQNTKYMFAYAYEFEGKGLELWNTSSFRDMSFMFSSASSFSGDISSWDVSQVTTMEGTFRNASMFECDLKNWNTLAVENMDSTFQFTPSFTGQGLEHWNVGRVTTMWGMFLAAHVFDANLSSWITSNVEDMSLVFDHAYSFRGAGLSAWDTSKVTSMWNMFTLAESFDENLSAWDTSKVNSMLAMFGGASSFEGHGLSNWNVSSVLDMSSMFWMTHSFDEDLSRWRTGNVNSMRLMFNDATSFSGRGLENWDTSNVYDMAFMFYNASSFDANLSSWNTSKVQDMMGMFYNAKSFTGEGLDFWDTSSVTSMNMMLAQASLFTANLSSWNVSQVSDMTFMFLNATYFNSDVSDWSVSNVQDATMMFAYATSFNQSLCEWGTSLLENTKVQFMFGLTGCLTTEDPNMTKSVKGPFCHPC